MKIQSGNGGMKTSQLNKDMGPTDGGTLPKD